MMSSEEGSLEDIVHLDVAAISSLGVQQFERELDTRNVRAPKRRCLCVLGLFLMFAFLAGSGFLYLQLSSMLSGDSPEHIEVLESVDLADPPLLEVNAPDTTTIIPYLSADKPVDQPSKYRGEVTSLFITPDFDCHSARCLRWCMSVGRGVCVMFTGVNKPKGFVRVFAMTSEEMTSLSFCRGYKLYTYTE